jgi:hypothetical protein
MTALSYREFLEAKKPEAASTGFEISTDATHPACRTAPHEFQAPLIQWAVRGGRRALFVKFGLGKTFLELEALRLILAQLAEIARRQNAVGGELAALVVTPLGVRQEFYDAAAVLGIELRFIQSDSEMTSGWSGIYMTNYESIREGKIDPSWFKAIALDEASALRSLGSKTFREFYRQCQHVPYKLVATATPAPNEYIELLNYAMWLGVMDIGEAKTRFFSRNSERSDDLTLLPHKEREFWLWVHTWAVFIQKPSDLGFSDEGYELPEVEVFWHVVGVDHATAGPERDGQGRMFHDAALGLKEAAAAKRTSVPDRVDKGVGIIRDRTPLLKRATAGISSSAQWVVWADRNDEQDLVAGLLREVGFAVPSVTGSQSLDVREQLLADWKARRSDILVSKPVMLGSGVNMQQCWRALFLGVGYKFNDFIQAFHRIVRFGQRHGVEIHVIYSEAEAAVVKELQRKWADHDRMMARMSDIIRELGLATLSPADQLSRSIGVERREAVGLPRPDADEERHWLWCAVNNDNVEETKRMPENCVGLIATSIPFSTQYEYTPSYNDFGHTDSKAHFFEQMDYLTPELFRVLEPGRVMAVHVKDRVRPGGYDNRGFQSIDFFHVDVIQHYLRHGFVGMGMITIVTDVVRENAQTYRLTWSMQCEDGSRMGVGMPEYVILLRKPPTDSTRGYADVPVVKSKAEYTKGRWQMEAHALWKSNGNRLLGPEDFVGREWKEVFNKFRGWTMATPYDHERVVSIAEAMDAVAQLPPDFMLLQPGIDHPDVWVDVMRARTLNGAQSAAGREKHLCPLQFDVVDRLISRFSNPGDLVMDPFGGLGTVALQAVKAGRCGLTVELNPQYHDDAVRYLRAHDEKVNTPTLFDLPSNEGEKTEELVEVG